MAVSYAQFLKSGIDLSPLGVLPANRADAYDCTPKGARIFARAGVDGIHFCFVRGFGETVFAVSPMNGATDTVHPVAANFEDFLRLLLSCGDTAPLEQAWQWNEAQFDAFLRDNPPTDEQNAVLDRLRALPLEPMPAPWVYIHALQADFDDTPFRRAGKEAPAPETAGEWAVYFEGGFWRHRGRDHAGRELPLNRRFSWGGEEWLVPAAYVCGRGMVIDLCRRVEPERLRAFIDKWDLEAEDELHPYSADEERLIDAENPLTLDFHAELCVNGQTLTMKHGYGVTHNPLILSFDEDETRPLIAHYHLDEACGRAFTRLSFPWKRKPRSVKSLALSLHADEISLPGPRLHLEKAGDSAVFTDPDGQTHTLTLHERIAETTDLRRFMRPDTAYPEHYQIVVYSVEPDLPAMQLIDTEESDHPVSAADSASGDMTNGENAAIGIIGGADGPTALFVGAPNRDAAQRHMACSALRFTPRDALDWRVIFRKVPFKDAEIELF